MKKIDLHIHTVSTISDRPFTFSLDAFKRYVTDAKLDAVAVTLQSEGPPNTWASQWASETIIHARSAFRGLRFGPKEKGAWPVKFKDLAKYDSDREDLQRSQIIKAGTRLAELLQAIWPD